MLDAIARGYLFATGQDTDGGRRTNATFLRHGTEVLEGDEASRWAHQPHARRALVRWSIPAAAVATGWGAWVAPDATVDTWRVVVWCAIAFGLWLVVHLCRRWQLRSKIVATALAVAPLLGYSRHLEPASWLRVPRDYRSNPDRAVTVVLPSDFSAPKGTRDRIITTATGRLGLGSADAEWLVDRTPPVLVLRAAPAPPERVGMALLEDLIAEAGPGELVLGGGTRGKGVVADLDGENPHMGLSVTTGGGKSVTATVIAMQVLRGLKGDTCGGQVLILDPKVVSLQWAKGLPGVRYESTIPGIHKALLEQATEIDRRYDLIGAHADVDGNIDPTVVGPRGMTIVEEVNTLMPRLQAYWREIRQPGDPQPSPAVAAFRSGLAMGRQGRWHVTVIAQYLTAAVTGGGDARENLSTRILIRPTAKAWNLLAPECKVGSKFPRSLTRPGSAHVVVGGVATPCQVGFPSPAEARAYVLAGEHPTTFSFGPGAVSPGTVPAVSPGDRDTATGGDAGTPRRLELVPPPADDVDEPADAPTDDEVLEGELVEPGPVDAPRTVSLRAACDEGLVRRSFDAARKARTRSRRAVDGKFPTALEHGPGGTELYLAADLVAWDAADTEDAEGGESA